MLVGGLFILFLLQLFVIISDIWLSGKEGTTRMQRLQKITRRAFVALSIIGIVYTLIVAIYILNQDTGFFAKTQDRAVLITLFILIILGNIAKFVLAFLTGKYKKIGMISCFIYMMSIASILVLVVILPTCSVTYVLDGNRKEVEQINYNSIEFKEDVDSPNTYEFVVFDSNNNEYDLDLENNIISAKYDETRYIKKYEIKEIKENCFEVKKTNTYYEYVIYTPDETEKNFISYYALNEK